MGKGSFSSTKATKGQAGVHDRTEDWLQLWDQAVNQSLEPADHSAEQLLHTFDARQRQRRNLATRSACVAIGVCLLSLAFAGVESKRRQNGDKSAMLPAQNSLSSGIGPTHLGGAKSNVFSQEDDDVSWAAAAEVARHYDEELKRLRAREQAASQRIRRSQALLARFEQTPIQRP